ncbi:MAG: universal stress protein [Chromatiales bacterium]|nr:universal stress protein [Chromatiales bacterium]
MPVYEQILAAIDFGEHSPTVVRRASAIAQQCSANLMFFTVVDSGGTANKEFSASGMDDNEELLIESARKRLNELVDAEAPGTNFTTLVVSGRAKVELSRVAERERADLIVVGAHVRHGFADLFGSTAAPLLQSACCDVLTVR